MCMLLAVILTETYGYTVCHNKVIGLVVVVATVVVVAVVTVVVDGGASAVGCCVL